MRDWAALDWRAFGLAWIAVVFGGDHLDSGKKKDRMSVDSKSEL